MAFRPNFLAGRPISPLIEVHLARPNTKSTQNGPFIFGLFAFAALMVTPPCALASHCGAHLLESTEEGLAVDVAECPELGRFTYP